jgi:large subunit ribosomal protein L1
MAQTKKELLEQAKTLGVEVDAKAKVADIKALIAESADKPAKKDVATEEEAQIEAAPEADEPVAKAGKRSAKALKETAEKEAKEERKQSGEEVVEKPKAPEKPARSRLERRGKNFRKSAEAIETGKFYSLEQAIELAKKTSHVKFDATVELHVNLGVDPRHADQNIRDNLVLPSGTGKTVKIAVLTDDAATAKKAGADVAGTDDLFAQFDKGVLDFDILIATPQQMPKLGKYARVLGPRGLMPNPKSGTVTTDIDKAVAEAKAGRVEYRVDSTGIVHLGVGKVSFTQAQLLDNLQAVMASLKSNKPGSVKGNYLKTIHLTTSMGPSIPVDVANVG